MNTAGAQDRLRMETSDLENSKSHNDIMTRRLKNRERQRRYRARKRLEADNKNSRVLNLSSTQQVEQHLNGVLDNCATRVHCKRNWKKEARMAYACKVQGDTPNGVVIPALNLNVENQTTTGTKAELPLERKTHSENTLALVNCATHKTVLSRRDWKADARKKKN